MNWVTRIATIIVYSNAWIAAGAALLTAQTYWVSGLEANSDLVIFVFCATIATYNFQRLIRFSVWSARIDSERIHWIIRSRIALMWLITAGLAGAMFFAFRSLLWLHYWMLIPLGIIALLYALPFIPLNKKWMALRDLPVTKIFWIAGTWAVVTAILPLLGHRSIDVGWNLLVIERFFFLLAITIPFDTRDMQYDDPAQKTLPQLIGIRNSGWLAQFCNLFFVAMIIINYRLGWYSTGVAQALIASAVITGVLLVFSFKRRKEPYYSGLVDGLTLLQPVMAFLWLH